MMLWTQHVGLVQVYASLCLGINENVFSSYLINQMYIGYNNYEQSKQQESQNAKMCSNVFSFYLIVQTLKFTYPL